MSDILIHGMEMYERCHDPDGHRGCPLFGSVYPYGFFCKATKKEIDNPFSRQLWCPLIELPPHGNLVDVDALYAEVKKHATPSDTWVFSFIRTAPIILPVEEE